MPQQQATTGPALMEGVERTNAVMVCPNSKGQGLLNATHTLWRCIKGNIRIVTTVGGSDI